MHLHSLKLLLLLVFAACFNRVCAQSSKTCSGSLGDPVISETFGSGTDNPGDGLPIGTTNLIFSRSCAADGFYNMVTNTNINQGGNCHPEAWQTLYHDHTGNNNGYMMLINASYTPSVFFNTTTPAVLCENTTYEFSAYIFNLIRVESSNNEVKQPNILFTISTVNGVVLDTLATGIIPPSQNSEDWVKKSFYFTTPPNTSQVMLTMSNKAEGGNGNDLLLDDITFRACGPLVQTGFNIATANQSQNQCIGETKTYTLRSNVVGNTYLNPKRQWQRDTGNGWADLPGETNESYTFTVSDNSLNTYRYRLAAAEGSNINSPNCRVFSEPLSVTVNPYPVVADVLPVQVCEGSPVALNVFGGISVEWTGPGITAANKNQNPLLIPNAALTDAGTYSFTVKNAGGCGTTKSTTISVLPKAVITLNAPTVTICKGASTNLIASANGAVSYRWSPAKGLSNPAIANPVASPTDTTIYTVTTTNSIGCIDSAKLTVNVLPPPVAITEKTQSMFEDRPITLTASAKNADVYRWTPTTGLSDPTVLNPVANPNIDITYTLHVTSKYNCGEDSSSVFIKVYHKISVPTAFSPNADGHNDAWEIEGLITYPESVTQVFNRYGQQVFKSKGYAKPWRGTIDGVKLPFGTYYYIIDTKTNAPKLTGWVQILN
jgi:gliding motility-associated-like protein